GIGSPKHVCSVCRRRGGACALAPDSAPSNLFGGKERVMVTVSNSGVRRGISRTTKSVLTIAAIGALAPMHRDAYAGGDFDGGQVSAIQTRMWAFPINWNFDIAPTPADALTFSTCGDGIVDLGGIAYMHPSATFDDWVTYTLAGPAGSSLSLTSAPTTF